MRFYRIVIGIAFLLVPAIAYGSFNDVIFDSTTNFSIGGYTLEIISANAEQVTVDTSSFDIEFAGGGSSSFEVRSTDKITFTVTQSSGTAIGQTTTCTSTYSSLILSNGSENGASSVTVTPNGNTCSSSGSSGGGGGGGGGSSSSTGTVNIGQSSGGSVSKAFPNDGKLFVTIPNNAVNISFLLEINPRDRNTIATLYPLPVGMTVIGELFAELATTPSSGIVFTKDYKITFENNDTQLTGLDWDKNSIEIYHYDQSLNKWQAIQDSKVLVHSKNLVSAEGQVSSFGIFALLGKYTGEPLPVTSVQTQDQNQQQVEQLSVSSFVKDLSLGRVDIDVKKLQEKLNTFGFMVSESGAGSSGNETTYFGSKTRSALAAYQAANDISPAVGYFGPITRKHLNEKMGEDPAPSSTPELALASSVLTKPPINALFTKPLFNGMSDPDVLRLQQFLNSDSDTKLADSGPGSPGNETQYFGPRTEKAVQNFQLKHEIVADSLDPGFGYVGPKTRANLGEIFGNSIE